MIRKKTAAYAVLALFEIADQHQGIDHPTGVRASDIAEKHKLPKAYVAKILSNLASAEIVNSTRGPTGGFTLARPTNKITLYDIYVACGAIPEDKRRHLRDMPPQIQKTLGRSHDQESASMKKVATSTTLADILRVR